jgi:nitrate reductase (cytochrome), electron transfer subunit
MDEIAPPPEHHTADDLLPDRLRRFVPLLAMIGVSLAVVGFVTGIRDPAAPPRPAPAVRQSPNAGPVPPAVSYAELPTANLRPSVGPAQTLADLRYDRPGIFDAVTRTEEMKLAALADRARNRAYDGAPPTIPHAVEAQSAASCLACHGDGLKVGDRIASKISHTHMTNCTQCHVEQAPASLPFRADPPGNTFTGVYRAGPGERASPGAPPTVPHHTWMRENCASCHGLATRAGTRTTHPWLTNCTQCHAASAALDQVQFLGAGR